MNDWNRERWLSIPDDRIRSVVLVQTQIPEEAAQEIRRVGGHPKIAAVLLLTSALGKPFGHPVYHTIYEAAADMGLAVAIHTGGLTGGISGGHAYAGGVASSRFEHVALIEQDMQHHILSFIAHGVFEKFRHLNLLAVETGVTWLPSFIWRMDANFKLLQRESSWVKRRPSEYFREHVKITTQPVETIPSRKFKDLFDTYDFLEDVLCFSTDYPHWDTDDPMYIAKRLPKSWLPKVFYKNALAVYGWDERDVRAPWNAD
jgi:predicted TIM-barrel fold metal-dependent hydrolase